jgi:predicted N-acetyltransferase YhbS
MTFELGGDDAWRSEYRGTRGESRTGRFRRNLCERDVHADENQPDIREAVESATSADPITSIRRDRIRVLKDGLVRRRDRRENTITQIAMWRVRRKPEQQRAE